MLNTCYALYALARTGNKSHVYISATVDTTYFEAQCVDNINDSAHMALYLLRGALSILTRADEAY